MAIEAIIEKSQIGWRDLGDYLLCDIPGVSEDVRFNMTELHESWEKFIPRYGVQQWIGSELAKLSIPIEEELAEEYRKKKKAAVKAGVSKEELEEFEDVKRRVKAVKVENAKKKAKDVQHLVWSMMQMLKVQRVAKAKAEKETKAQVETRLAMEFRKDTAIKMRAMGMSEEQIESILGK